MASTNCDRVADGAARRPILTDTTVAPYEQEGFRPLEHREGLRRPQSEPPRRVFVVGCPRSGTTLLQAMLAAHSQVFSFPESHFFKKIWGRLWRLRALGLVSPRAASRTLDRLLEEVNWPHPRPLIPPWPLYSTYAFSFARVLDRSCLDAGKQVWVEKSPIHLHCQPYILRAMPDARFLHILRDGKEVVASFYELCLRNPPGWIPQIISDRHLDLADECSRRRILGAVIERWNRDVTLTMASRQDSAHFIVRYDRLVQGPERTLREVSSFLGLEFEQGMLRHWEGAASVVGWRSQFSHVQRVFEPVQVSVESKFSTILTPIEQDFVATHLRHEGDIQRLLGASN